jgi:hypothetical protein
VRVRNTCCASRSWYASSRVGITRASTHVTGAATRARATTGMPPSSASKASTAVDPATESAAGVPGVRLQVGRQEITVICQPESCRDPAFPSLSDALLRPACCTYMTLLL